MACEKKFDKLSSNRTLGPYRWNWFGKNGTLKREKNVLFLFSNVADQHFIFSNEKVPNEKSTTK